MNIHHFCKNYSMSPFVVEKAIKKNYLVEGVHYTVDFNLHQLKRRIIKPDEAYQIILSRSKIARNRANAV